MRSSKKRRSRRLSEGEILPEDHDGILDVLANLVGVLVLVGSLTAVLAANSAIKIKTPLAKSTNKDFVLLQVGKAGVWDLQRAKDRMVDLDKQRIAGWKQCLNLSLYDMIYCVNEMRQWSAFQRVGQVQVEIAQDGAKITRMQSPTEQSEKMEMQGSWTRTKLKNASDNGKAIFLILEKEGFSNFRTIRTIAAEYGLELGWEPWKTGESVFFGSGGRTMTVQ